ncbi:hypothetical protein [Amycolatopsis panacis]|uniref:hypothetical protein n=1 Tax=Amycolatopsis panacis TaxID=2340917 RepID=UPI0011C3B9B3|nr:hypothetical protein [Amycolatopsis panacis]
MPDYTSTLYAERDAGDQRTAEQWARAVWEDAPLPMRMFLRAGWRCLGLRSPRAPDRVLGWTIAESTPDSVVLEIPSRIMTARTRSGSAPATCSGPPRSTSTAAPRGCCGRSPYRSTAA